MTDNHKNDMVNGHSGTEMNATSLDESSSPKTVESVNDPLDADLSPVSSPDSLPSEPLINKFRSTVTGKRSRSPTLRRTSQLANTVANTSFGSVSTLTTLPSSQISESSSRRIFLNGEDMVTNSSSDVEPLDDIAEVSHESTSDSESGSESDFDLDALIANKRQRLADQPPTPKSIAPTVPDDRQLRSAVKSHVKPTPRRHASPPIRVIKNNLAALLKQKKKDDELAARLQELERTVASYTEAEKHQAGGLQHPDTPVGDKVAAVMKQDGDTDQRLRQAMQRVDALEHEVVFHFFDAVQEDVPRHEFPDFCLPETSWARIMKSKTSRDQFILYGFARDIAIVTEFPAELQEWMLGEILFEHREDLSLAYVGVLEACSTHHDVSPLLDMPMLADCLERLGIREEIIKGGACLDFGRTEEHKKPNVRVGQRGLLNFLTLLAKLGKRLQATVRHAAFYFLSLMLIDNTVMGDGYLTKKIRDSLVILVADLDDADVQDLLETTGNNLLQTVQDPVLFSHLTSRLPTSTPTTCLIRRQLALSFLPNDTSFDQSALTSPSTSSTLLNRLTQDPSYAITGNTDYTILGALITTLDTALGVGFSSFTFLTSPSSESTRAAEAAFNNQIDALVAALKNLSSHIRDAGAAHMRRTECKGAIDRLVFRLQYAVRTKSKVKKGVFGSLGRGAWTGMEGQSGGMEKFVRKSEVS